MVLPVHLRFSAVVAIVDCPGRSQFIGSPSLKQAAPQSIRLFQESLITISINCERELWRVARVEPKNRQADFRNDPFEKSVGISRSNWGKTPVRVLE